MVTLREELGAAIDATSEIGEGRRVRGSVADLLSHAAALAPRIARYTQQGLASIARAGEVGCRQLVRERDEPFGDYGSRKKG